MSGQVFLIKPSKIYLSILMIATILSLFIIERLPFSFGIKTLFIIALFLYMGNIIWVFGLLRSKRSIRQITHKQKNHWILQTEESDFEAELSGDSTVINQLAVLRFQIAGSWRAKSCIIFPDALEQGLYRKLMVSVRMG